MSVVTKSIKAAFTALGIIPIATMALADETNHFDAMLTDNCSSLISDQSLNRLLGLEKYLAEANNRGWTIQPNIQQAIIDWAQGNYSGPQIFSPETITELESAKTPEEFKAALNKTLPAEASATRMLDYFMCP